MKFYRDAMGLTPREAEVYKMLGDGLDVHEISARLGTRSSTVRNQIAEIRRALGLHSRAEIVAHAEQRRTAE